MAEQITTKSFVDKMLTLHNKYDYSKVVYVNSYTKVCIICPKHGEFWQLPSAHSSGKGCKKCGVESAAKIQAMAGKRRFFVGAPNIHGNRYDYSKVECVNNRIKVCIVCPDHGDFWQSPVKHMGGSGCPKCSVILGAIRKKSFHKAVRPDLSHIITPEGSKAVPVGTKGDYALVDDEDYDRVMEYNWRKQVGYASNFKVGLMHRFILNPPDDMVVDHINHNPLDNRRINIRICTQQENVWNMRPYKDSTSKFKGVSLDRRSGKWVAQLKVDGKHVLSARFNVEEEAALAYNEAAVKYRGEFANLNTLTE